MYQTALSSCACQAFNKKGRATQPRFNSPTEIEGHQLDQPKVGGVRPNLASQVP